MRNSLVATWGSSARVEALNLLLAGSLALAVLLALWVAARISRPVTHLTAVADKVSNGDPTQKLEVTGSGEIRDLAHAFGRMINCLKVMESLLRDEAKAQEDAP